jgi:hypothetical protein
VIKDTIDWSQTAHRRAAQYTDALSKLCARADLTSSRYLSVVPIGLAGINTYSRCHTHKHTQTHTHTHTHIHIHIHAHTHTHIQSLCRPPPPPTHPRLSRRCLLGLYTCVLVLLYICPHITTYVSSYHYICVLVLSYVSLYYYMCVLILCLGRLSRRKQHERNTNPTQRKKSLAGPLSIYRHVAASTEC